MLNPKQSNIPMFKTFKFMIWNLKYWDLFRISDLVLGIFLSLAFIYNVYALDLDRIKTYFLSGDYKSAIAEGENILASPGDSAHLDELYYILGLSYLKDGNYLRASDIFEIILKEFKDSAFKEEAKLGLGDTYFLRGDFAKAQDYYKELISSNPHTKLLSAVYYRLSQGGLKTGDTQAAKEYLDKLKQDSPSNIELQSNKDLGAVFDSSAQIYYSVQVNAFANSTNAKNLRDKLLKNGYDAYIEEVSLNDKQIYRVKVGKLRLRSEAVQLENKLSSEGYPTRICP